MSSNSTLAVSSTTEVVTDNEAACLNEAEETHDQYSPQLSAALRKLGDFYRESGDSANLESTLQRILMFDERVAGRIHSDTIATSFSLTDVYIQRGNLKKRLSCSRESRKATGS